MQPTARGGGVVTQWQWLFPLIFSGWRSQRKQKRRNKTWLWAPPLPEGRRRSLLRPSPSWHDGPPSQLVQTLTSTEGNRKYHWVQWSGRRTNHLLPWSQIQCCWHSWYQIFLCFCFFLSYTCNKYVSPLALSHITALDVLWVHNWVM